MESSQTTDYAPRASRQSHYDKRLILKIVKEVEEGLPRKEAIRIYGLGKASIDGWMKEYGSDHYHDHVKRKKYTNLQKRTIVSALEQGRMSLKEAQVAYKIKSSKIIREWLRQYKSEKVEICIEKQVPMSKKKKVPATPQTAALQKALQEAELKIKALNTLIDVAEEQLKIDIRKKSGARQS
ncbi:helix-turn-helix domain-containing protein [Flavitalea sp.]|nr:helix-turn-helix domain-containing protein [Flavitalea sp.]